MKLQLGKTDCTIIVVAPLAGAWLETNAHCAILNGGYVAPLAGAWLETRANSMGRVASLVAPLAGAWLETSGEHS